MSSDRAQEALSQPDTRSALERTRDAIYKPDPNELKRLRREAGSTRFDLVRDAGSLMAAPQHTYAAGVAERVLHELTESTVGGNSHNVINALRALDAVDMFLNTATSDGSIGNLHGIAKANAVAHLELLLAELTDI